MRTELGWVANPRGLVFMTEDSLTFAQSLSPLVSLRRRGYFIAIEPSFIGFLFFRPPVVMPIILR